MLIIALVLALIGLVALVFAVVTSNELVAWVCIGASALGVVLLIIDAVRERQQREVGGVAAEPEDQDEAGTEAEAVDYPEEVPGEDESAAEETESEATKESTVSGDESAK
ncbi:hypothetical protein [Mycobacterium angelicum]|uniref:Transmembrane protein n=1 Tax=Mycobacterium angelicum TaxID=470074 RepID=A0A1W9ZMI3_MYCAN|nr:hypothetical protein [Mycobacterium angelicum]MCV7195777.1 hypothetical protein [Mycobacterium angelicum]ORA18480.1 hypothetical protein BST12_18615 [Mycobacterium angelicum]